ncbi:hypothetical protein HCR18_01060 [Wolbachia pipientis]|uniref:hypothetical protein n=1 Tax=Wolbachia pipientis TaxID=955 RepID=UPI0015F87EB6|nr:hypothetical protein [Wolbachia pipientis]MBA8757707.1 hypothetical protein [Wolbachia pipientis]MBA8769933.1 hypothetical protein [Wolbachia pipientis]
MVEFKVIMLQEYPEVFYVFHSIPFRMVLIEVNSTEWAQTLYSSAKAAYLEFKQTDKFLTCLANNIEEVLDEKEVELLSEKQKSLSKNLS